MKTVLHEPVFRPLHMGEIKPAGWLLAQLKIQAEGLSGNLDKFWPDIKESRWIGGTAEGWERVPYWLDGFIPLAWLLDDEDMKNRAKRYIDYIIKHQTPDGWICATDDSLEERSKYDLWALFLILKVLVVYHDATNDERIEKVVQKALQYLDRHIDVTTLFNWGQTRWFESLISIWWLYERTEEEWLINLASKLHGQGFDWQSFFMHWPYKKPDEKGRWSQMSHVVNNAMMLKSGALLWRMTGQDEHLNSTEHMVELLDQYHGMITGVFTGDECLAGTSPIHGTELCAVAEYMYSLEHLAAITGHAHWGDRLEQIAYNALPATFSPDMWTHQYDQQVNQVQCSKQDNSIFNTNGGDSNIFGLEPNFGCCTANLSQAWPKLALSTFMRSSDGLAVIAYAPCTVDTLINDTQVKITLETGYPFRDVLHFTINVEHEVDFALRLRIPAWAEGAEIEMNGCLYPAQSNSFHCIEQKWCKESSFTLRLPMKPILAPRPNNLYAITRGPLVFTLPIGERWEQINQNMPGHEAPHCDYELYPTTPWNYGICTEVQNVFSEITFEEKTIGNCPFSPQGAPVIAHIKGKKIEWGMQNGAASIYPEMGWISDKLEDLTLIPYGCSNLRITEMPLLLSDK